MTSVLTKRKRNPSLDTLEDIVMGESKRAKLAAETSETLKKQIPVSSELWVDKYAPKKFKDLLSNEKTNREVIQWIKKWDNVVFSNGTTKGEKDSRPEKKILLLAGSPGIGKTTLAHVLSKHTGYNTVEINASDDRTKSKFKPKIEAAIEMRSVFGSRKPNFLIIDEIDGISPSEGMGVAKVLLDIAKSTKKPLRRPIICICNDPYAPALRELRKYALLFRLSKPKMSSLSCRLLEICKLEGINTNAHALTLLCSLSDNDIRSCLNSLQFMEKDANGKITAENIKLSAIGTKDLTKSIFTVWDHIFHPQYKKQAFRARIAQSFGSTIDKSAEKTKNSSSDHINDTVLAHGDLEKIVEGCHSHYLSMKYLDTSMKKTSSICDAIAWASDFSTRGRKYVPFGLMQITQNIPQEIEPTLHFPSEMSTLRRKRIEHENITKTFKLGLHSTVLQSFPQGDMMADFFSYLLRIVTPNVKVMNNQLLKLEEKEKNKRVVSLMNAYSLTYTQEYQPCREGGQALVQNLDPPIHLLCNFSDVSCDSVSKLSSQQKTMLALEVEQLKFALRPRAPVPSEIEILHSREKQGASPSVVRLNPSVTRSPHKVKQVTAPFFQQDSTKADNSSDQQRYSKHSDHAIFFKYQEGSTNAVRRTVYVKDLL